ncbi:MAG: prenyltransferase/squalene oxidase repeat-containing protein [Prosthecobacter sp.]|nr:prenyltransferase/squalene oxidase repeat-containing protein [Prosthecobacter sp.]
MNVFRAIVAVGLLSGACSGADSPLRLAVGKSLTYLTDGGREWMEDRNCVSCHHTPMTIWSLHHAKQNGFTVDEETLAKVMAWSLDPKLRLMPRPPEKKVAPEPEAKGEKPEAADPGADNPPFDATYFILATDRVEPSFVPAPTRAILVRKLLDKQEADGSWLSYVAHPPMLDRGETTTLNVLLALLGKDGKCEPTDPDWNGRKTQALEFLAKSKPSDELQPKLWRLLLRKYLGPTANLPGTQAEEVKVILGQQHADGGWGQTPALPSDAFATGQVLYLLTAADCQISPETRTKAIGFLLKNQQADGSWLMASRARLLPKPSAGAGNLDMIRYAGTAWAAMGLISIAGK